MNSLVKFIDRYQTLHHEALIHPTIVKCEALIVVTTIIIIIGIEKVIINDQVMMNQMIVKLIKRNCWRLHKEMPLKWHRFELLCLVFIIKVFCSFNPKTIFFRRSRMKILFFCRSFFFFLVLISTVLITRILKV